MAFPPYSLFACYLFPEPSVIIQMAMPLPRISPVGMVRITRLVAVQAMLASATISVWRPGWSGKYLMQRNIIVAVAQTRHGAAASAPISA